MSKSARPPAVTVTRTIVVRVIEQLDDTKLGQLKRILDDLIDDQGVSHLIVDISDAGEGDFRAVDVVTEAADRLDKLGGLLELRAPTNLSPELRDLADEIPMFTALQQIPDSL